jgi:hypothetical protein
MPHKPCDPGCTCGLHPSPESVQERFWSRVDTSGDCWLWTGSLFQKTGYGKFSRGGRHQYAHRVAYEFLVGPIPERRGLDHRHTCPKNCVNPAHLRPATQKQNMENRSGAQRNNLSSGVRGVTWDKERGKWQAKVKHNGRYVFAGRFDDLADAEAAAVAKRNQLFTHNDMDRVAS